MISHFCHIWRKIFWRKFKANMLVATLVVGEGGGLCRIFACQLSALCEIVTSRSGPVRPGSQASSRPIQALRPPLHPPPPQDT